MLILHCTKTKPSPILNLTSRAVVVRWFEHNSFGSYMVCAVMFGKTVIRTNRLEAQRVEDLELKCRNFRRFCVSFYEKATRIPPGHTPPPNVASDRLMANLLPAVSLAKWRSLELLPQRALFFCSEPFSKLNPVTIGPAIRAYHP